MKWSNSVSDLICVIISGNFNVRMCINDFMINDGLNYIKSDNNIIMLLVPGEHNYRQFSD
jgi:hypothetical protein